jgi:glutathione synthase
MKIAVFMDELTKLDPPIDSTFLMLQRAKQLGFTYGCFTQKDLCYHAGKVYADLFTIDYLDTIESSPLNWTATTALGTYLLEDFDVILVRKDPPFDAEYIYATYLLELVEKSGVIVSNKPQSLRDANEKLFTLWFQECCPETLVSCNIEKLRQFWKIHKHIIVKPLDGLGGKGVFEIGPEGYNVGVIFETLTNQQTTSVMVQKYIPEIRHSGDKRIILINGEPLDYALARIPAVGEVRGNLKAGATGNIVPITQRDRWLCAQLSPVLKDKGLHLVGLDVIGDYITEINVTSPSCLRDITTTTKLDIAGQYLSFLNELIHG